MIKSFNHYTQLNYENTNIFGYLSQEILMFIKILLFWFQAAQCPLCFTYYSILLSHLEKPQFDEHTETGFSLQELFNRYAITPYGRQRGDPG